MVGNMTTDVFDPGLRRLALSLIKDALHQWNKSGAREAKDFLEGDMWPYIEWTGMDISDARLRRALRRHGLTPLDVAQDG
jgi:hypothetical protein